MCSACDVPAVVREGQQYPGPGKAPSTENKVLPKRIGRKHNTWNIY